MYYYFLYLVTPLKLCPGSFRNSILKFQGCNRYNKCISHKDTKWEDDKQINENIQSVKKEESSSDSDLEFIPKSKRFKHGSALI